MSAGKDIAIAGVGIAVIAGVMYWIYKKWGLGDLADKLKETGCDTETGIPTTFGKLIERTPEECAKVSKSTYVPKQEGETHDEYLWRANDAARQQAASQGKDPNTALVTLDIPWYRDPVIATTPTSSQQYQQDKAEAQTWMATNPDDAGITAPFGSPEYNAWAQAHPEEASFEAPLEGTLAGAFLDYTFPGMISTAFGAGCPEGYYKPLFSDKCVPESGSTLKDAGTWLTGALW